jgi:hypothetical protein
MRTAAPLQTAPRQIAMGDGRGIGHPARGDLLEHREPLSHRATLVPPHAGEIAPWSQDPQLFDFASARIRTDMAF